MAGRKLHLNGFQAPAAAERYDSGWFDDRDAEDLFLADPLLTDMPVHTLPVNHERNSPTQSACEPPQPTLQQLQCEPPQPTPQQLQHLQLLQQHQQLQLQVQTLQHQQQLQQLQQLQQFQQFQNMQQLHHLQLLQQQQQSPSSVELDFSGMTNAKLHKLLAERLPKTELEQAVNLLRSILLQARPVKVEGRAKGMLTWPLPPPLTRPLPMILELADGGVLPWRERTSEASLQASLALYDNDATQAGILGVVGLSQKRLTTWVPLKGWLFEVNFPHADVPYNASKHSFFIELTNVWKHPTQRAKRVSLLGRLKHGGGPLRHDYCFNGSGLRYSYEPDQLFWPEQLPEASCNGRVVVDLVSKTPQDSSLDPVCKIKPLFGFGRIEFNFILRQAGQYMLQVSLELAGATPASAGSVVSQLATELREGLSAEAYYSCETPGQSKLKQNTPLYPMALDDANKAFARPAGAPAAPKEQLDSLLSPMQQWQMLRQQPLPPVRVRMPPDVCAVPPPLDLSAPPSLVRMSTPVSLNRDSRETKECLKTEVPFPFPGIPCENKGMVDAVSKRQRTHSESKTEDPVLELLRKLRVDSAVETDERPIRQLSSPDNSTLKLRSPAAWASDCHVYFHFDSNTCVQATAVINPYQPQDMVVCIPPIPQSIIESAISYVQKARPLSAPGVVLQPFVSANVVVATSPTVTEPIYGYYTYPQCLLPNDPLDVLRDDGDNTSGDDEEDCGGDGPGTKGPGRRLPPAPGRGGAGIVVDVTHKFFVPYNNLQSLITACLSHLDFSGDKQNSHPLSQVRTGGKLLDGLIGALQALLQAFVDTKLKATGPGAEAHIGLQQDFERPVHELISMALTLFCCTLEPDADPELSPSPFRTMHLLCLLLGHSELQHLAAIVEQKLAGGCDIYRPETVFGLTPLDLLANPQLFGYGSEVDVADVEDESEESEVLLSPEPSVLGDPHDSIEPIDSIHQPSSHGSLRLHPSADGRCQPSVHSKPQLSAHSSIHSQVRPSPDVPEVHDNGPNANELKKEVPPESIERKASESIGILGDGDPNNNKPSKRGLWCCSWQAKAWMCMGGPLLLVVILMVVLVFGFGLFTAPKTASPIHPVAFDGAEGFGADTPGGMNGIVITVTNLEASGPGSLQAAVSKSGPRLVVFQVSGIIDGDLDIENGDLTVAGETSQSGITIQGSVRINSVENVVLRFLRVRPGSETELNGVFVGFSRDVILDHLSLAWASGPLLDLQTVYNMTISFCTIEEPIADDAIAPPKKVGSELPNEADGIARGLVASHVFGLSFHHNLLAHTEQAIQLFHTSADIRNNVFYDCTRSLHGDKSQVNIVGNYFKPTLDVQDSLEPASLWTLTSDCEADVTDNYVSELGLVNSSVVAGTSRYSRWSSHSVFKTPLAAPPIKTHPPEDALGIVLAEAGCYPMDLTTVRIKREAVQGSGWRGRKDPPTADTPGVVALVPSPYNATVVLPVLRNGAPMADEWDELAACADLKMKEPFDVTDVDKCHANLTLFGALAFADAAQAARSLKNATFPDVPIRYPFRCAQEVYIIVPALTLPPNGWIGYVSSFRDESEPTQLLALLIPQAHVYLEFRPNGTNG